MWEYNYSLVDNLSPVVIGFLEVKEVYQTVHLYQIQETCLSWAFLLQFFNFFINIIAISVLISTCLIPIQIYYLKHLLQFSIKCFPIAQ